MKIRNSCDMSTCARQNRNGMCARLSLIRLNCSYEEALCPCLPIKRLAKKWSDWADDRAAGLYDFSMLWTRMAPSSPLLKDEHVQLSEMCFRRFWARRKSYVVQKAPILVGSGSTGPVFAPYWSARLAVGCSKARTASAWPRTASEGAPSETRGVHVRVHWAKNWKNTQWTWRTHVTIASQEVDFVRTSHGPQPPMAPQFLRAGKPVGLMHAT